MAVHKPFRFGAVGDVSSREQWIELARKVEDLGYATLLLGEHPSDGRFGPHFLVGTIEQIVEELHMRRERYGISYITVPDVPAIGMRIDVLGPVVARLAGT